MGGPAHCFDFELEGRRILAGGFYTGQYRQRLRRKNL
jgi:hypothetical protein